jgi:hypothetical protein
MKYRVLLAMIIGLMIFSSFVNSQPSMGPIVQGFVKNPDGSDPDSAEVEFFGFLNKSPIDQTEIKFCTVGPEGCGWAIDLKQDIPNTTWEPGDTLTVILKNVGGGEYDGLEFHLEYVTTNETFQIVYAPILLPVELITFTAQEISGLISEEVELRWKTASEKNNYGFYVERSSIGNKFENIGFVAGAGSCNTICEYKFNDRDVEIGKYSYRLKQMDTNGQFSYSESIQIEVAAPKSYSLEQNFPNPFNPKTDIVFRVKEDGKVRITVYDILGREVERLVDGQLKAGTHRITFNGQQLPSGLYLYRMEAADFQQVKKMALIK